MVEYSTERSDSFKPLRGLRVIDLGRVVSAPIAAAALGALGAEVIRVEQPGGDLSWKLPPFVAADGHEATRPDAPGIPLSHLRRSRGKRSVVLDLRSAEGPARLEKLVSGADVVVENFRPGTLDRLGVSPAALRQRHPGLIWCSISGYGSDGPWAHRAAIDITVQAESGLLHRTGDPDGPSVRAGATVVDHLAANWAISAVLAAVIERRETGRGRHLDVSMLEAISAVMWDDALDASTGVEERTGNFDPRGGPHGVYPCGTGSVAVVVTSDAQWRRLLDTHLDAPDLAGLDAAGRARNRVAVERALTRWTAVHGAETVADELSQLGISAGVVRPPSTTARHPQLTDRGFLAPLRSSDGTPVRYLGPALPYQVDGIHPRPGPEVEPLGASTADLLDDEPAVTDSCPADPTGPTSNGDEP